MTDSRDTPDAFGEMGILLKAWHDVVSQIDEDSVDLKKSEDFNAKEFLKHLTKIEDDETTKAFGFIAKSKEKTGHVWIAQSRIVNTVWPDGALKPEMLKTKRQAFRQSLKRRVDALEYFGLVKRKRINPVAAEFSITEKGKYYRHMYDTNYAAEREKRK